MPAGLISCAAPAFAPLRQLPAPGRADRETEGGREGGPKEKSCAGGNTRVLRVRRFVK